MLLKFYNTKDLQSFQIQICVEQERGHETLQTCRVWASGYMQGVGSRRFSLDFDLALSTQGEGWHVLRYPATRNKWKSGRNMQQLPHFWPQHATIRKISATTCNN